MGLLDDKVVLIHGGTQGVGAAVARAAGREGAAVAVTGRRADVGTAIVRELQGDGVAATYVQTDVADVDQIHRATDGDDRSPRADRLPRQRRRPHDTRDVARHDA